jgi:hypothetical protein
VRIHTRAIEPSTWARPEAKAAAVVNAIVGYRRRRLIGLVSKDISDRVIRRTTGMSRHEVSEWMYRRRHAVSFWFRNSWFRWRAEARERMYRRQHAVSFWFRDLWFRRRIEATNRMLFSVRDFWFRRRHEMLNVVRIRVIQHMLRRMRHNVLLRWVRNRALALSGQHRSPPSSRDHGK